MFSTKHFIGEVSIIEKGNFVIFNIWQKVSGSAVFIGQAMHSLVMNKTEINVNFLSPLKDREFVLNEIEIGVKDGISSLSNLGIK